jgi:16S rRNA (uracil1498-N3)-methyltransferase
MIAPRVHVDAHIDGPGVRPLPAAAARHAQVLRLQPGDTLVLFDGRGGQWSARVAAMGRRDVQVDVLVHDPVERELPIGVTLALAMPAGDRMDFVVEKATELGAAAIQPLVSERSVLRLAGERAARRVAHWQAIALAACEQCGRNRVPGVLAIRPLQEWLHGLPPAMQGETRLILGWRGAAPWPARIAQAGTHVMLLSGPEGGLSDDEQDAAHARGFVATSLGPRVLRADTAPLAALAALALSSREPPG